ncbi:endo-beta-N-acetylglucosaminidase [Paenibacillus sp. GCM10023248]|nr:endo-beta-N-acetylglucosaminidase [Paenibacillus sp. MAHUQ-63]
MLALLVIPLASANGYIEPTKGSHQPYAHGYTADEVLKWTAESDPYAKYLRSRVPLATRIPAFAATQAKPSLSSVPNMYTLAGDYESVKALGSFKTNNIYARYLMNFWQYTDTYSAWHGLPSYGTPIKNDGFATKYAVLNLPNPGYTDAAHRNGVLSMGCFFTPRDQQSLDQWLVQRKDGSFPIADKMIEMAQYFGYDGYFFNQEEGASQATANKFKQFLTYLNERAPANFHVQIYDALRNDGELQYQNAFNQNNDQWLLYENKRVADSMFLNYWWNSPGLTNSSSYAKSLGLNPLTDVAAGLEAGLYQYEPFFDPSHLLNPDGTMKTGIAQLGSDFVWSLFKGKDDPAQQEEVYKRERIWWSGPNQDPTNTGRNNTYRKWDGIAHYIAERSVIGSYPFVTRFNTGHGKQFFVNGELASTKEWNNASIQDILPTWQWWMTSSGTKLAPSFDYNDAYDGGSSLKITGKLKQPNDLRLFKTKLNVTNGVNLSITYKTRLANTATKLKVGLLFEDDPSGFTYLDVGNSATAGWETKTFDLSTYAGKTIAVIGLRFDGTSSSNYSINIGELALKDAAPTAPAAPSGFGIDKTYIATNTAELYLSWDFKSSDVWYYNINRVKPDGSRELLGRMYDEVYYVKELNRISNEQSSTLELTAVGFSGAESAPATTTLSWTSRSTPEAPSGLQATASGNEQINVTWNASAGATGYDLLVDNTLVSDVINPYSHSGLASGTHTYSVRAKNDAGVSEWSVPVSATVQR